MSKFWQVNEDPMYDEDGVLVDEDYDEEQGKRVFDRMVEELSPFETVNS
jgi:hypothetical protein